MAASNTCVRLALGVGDVTGEEVDDVGELDEVDGGGGSELDDSGELDSGGELGAGELLGPPPSVLLSEAVGTELGIICIEDDSGATAKS